MEGWGSSLPAAGSTSYPIYTRGSDILQLTIGASLILLGTVDINLLKLEPLLLLKGPQGLR